MASWLLAPRAAAALLRLALRGCFRTRLQRKERLTNGRGKKATCTKTLQLSQSRPTWGKAGSVAMGGGQPAWQQQGSQREVCHGLQQRKERVTAEQRAGSCSGPQECCFIALEVRAAC